jgi:hypothetical protein
MTLESPINMTQLSAVDMTLEPPINKTKQSDVNMTSMDQAGDKVNSK